MAKRVNYVFKWSMAKENEIKNKDRKVPDPPGSSDNYYRFIYIMNMCMQKPVCPK